MRRALLTLVCLIACKDKPVELPPPPQPPRDGVKLIQPGALPHQRLRYQFTKGARTASTLVCDFAIKNDGEGEAIPTLVVELETVVDDVLGDGSAKLRFTLTRARLRDAPSGPASDDLQAQATALEGVVITELLAPDGKSSEARVEQAATVPDKIRAQLDSVVQSLQHAAVQLPVEPIGVAATWQERRTLPPGGIQGVSEILYTVTALTPSSFTYASVGRLTGEPQTIERDGMKVEVTNTTGSSEAKGTLELSRYMLDVDVTSVFSSTMNAIAPEDTPGAGSSTVEIKMATRMTPGIASAAPVVPDGLSDGVPDDAATPPSDAGAPSGVDQGAHNAP
jgi:hypothetical protein